MSELVNVVLPIVSTILVCAFALLKGDEPERHGATIFFVAWLSTNLVVWERLPHGTTNILFAIDIVVMIALGGLAWTSRRAWAVLASVLQALGIIIHVARDTGAAIGDLTYYYALTISGYGQFLALAVGASIAWRERAALESFGIYVGADATSSPAMARSMSSSVRRTPKMATNDPNRGPWF